MVNGTKLAFRKNYWYGVGYLVGSWIYTPAVPLYGTPLMQGTISSVFTCANCDDEDEAEAAAAVAPG
jgi:hypothetical protein